MAQRLSKIMVPEPYEPELFLLYFFIWKLFYTHITVVSTQPSSDPALPWPKVLSSIFDCQEVIVQKMAFELAAVVWVGVL